MRVTNVFAVLGRPVGHSLSPALHGAWLREHGVDGVYVALEVPAGREAGVPEAVRTLHLAGANLTSPLKQAVVPGLDRLEGDAAVARAVNVLAWDGDVLVGANTDAEGFVLGLDRDPHGLGAAIAGTGGAARAVALGLAKRGASRIALLGRRPDEARSVAEELAAAFPRTAFTGGPLADEGLDGLDLVVDATAGPGVALDPHRLAPGAAWVDLAYGRSPRPGLVAAAAAGVRASDGLPMLVWQGALAFERWTGVRPEVANALRRLRAANMS